MSLIPLEYLDIIGILLDFIRKKRPVLANKLIYFVSSSEIKSNETIFELIGFPSEAPALPFLRIGKLFILTSFPNNHCMHLPLPSSLATNK